MERRTLSHPARLAGHSLLRLQSDARLVELARAGHEPALTAIVQRYRPALVRYCTGLLGADRAEDAVQQALANAHAALTAPDDRPLELRPWLYRLAHNAALNVLRASRDQAFGDGGTAGAGEPPEEVLVRRQQFDELLAAIAALPRAQRDSLLLRELEGRSHKEIASALGVSVGAVRQKLFRARAAVRAACTAVTPAPVLARLIELGSAPAVGGAAVTKAAAGLLATGALAGGAASTGVLPGDHPPAPAERAQAAAAKAVSETPAHETGPPAAERLGPVSSAQRQGGRRHAQPVTRRRSGADSRPRKERGQSEPTRSRQSTYRERPDDQEAGEDPRAAAESRHQDGGHEGQPGENGGRGDERGSRGDPETPTAGRERARGNEHEAGTENRSGTDRKSPKEGRSPSQSAPGGGKPDNKSPGGGKPSESGVPGNAPAGGGRPSGSGGKPGNESPGGGKPGDESSGGGVPGNPPAAGVKPDNGPPGGGEPGNESPGGGQPNESGGKPGSESGGGKPGGG